MPTHARSAAALDAPLRRCGYGDAQLAIPFTFDDVTVPIAAFAGKPWDSWSACIAVVESTGNSEAAATRVLPLGAPTVFVCHSQGVDWWRQGPSGPTSKRFLPWKQLDNAIDEHQPELHPSRIYAAKLRKPDAKSSQLWFFDAGLMPAVERNRGETLTRLIEDVIAALRDALGPRLKPRQAQEDVYRTVFWLVAAKVLRDKHVPNFVKINLTDLDEVFDRIGKHHGETNRFPPFGPRGRGAIDAAARRIAACGSLADVSSESLAFVYENALVDSSIRRQLGIHSTPSPLISHMLSQLWPMIEQIDPEDRHVFEPACGNARFLTAAMRWLRDWGAGGSSPTAHDYLRKHLRGIEADPFAVELAKLSLTLADEPHGNSWKLLREDMFMPAVLAKQAERATIVLANPPYEAFDASARARYKQAGEPVTALTKAVEMLNRTLPNLPQQAVFGVVVPQGTLHDAESRNVRRFLVEHCELTEVTLFADNLFEHGDHEVAVLLGRRRKPTPQQSTLTYRIVREKGMDAFKERLLFSSQRRVSQDRFATEPHDLRLPELDEVWSCCARYPKLGTLAHVGQGMIHHGQELPKDQWTVEPYRKGRGVPGFAEVPTDLQIYSLPPKVSINIDSAAIRRPVSGTTTGCPQVLVNYARVSRDPWKIKAILDPQGHAVTSRFLTVRPKSGEFPLVFYWAVLNSPVANAFVHTRSMKRDILSGVLRELPVPMPAPAGWRSVVEAANAYLVLASDPGSFSLRSHEEASIRQALLRLDAAVLRVYDLPPRLERELLDLFRGAERKGVGCRFGDYFPADFTPRIPLHEYISEDYRRSTAGELAKSFQPVTSDAARTALELAERLSTGR